MNAVILLSLLATCLARLEYVPNEYLIGIKSSTDGEVFSTLLTNDYDLEVKKMWDLGRVKILHVVGEQVDVENAGKLPEVKYWERNGYAHIQQTCTEGSAAGCWGLDRTDQAAKLNYTDPLSEEAVYTWGENMGTGVDAYVLDTGIDVENGEFQGRASWGYTADGILPGERDGNGHGTHVSGTIGSVSYGIAKDVNLIAVKVLDNTGSGPWTAVLDGMEWVRGQHVNGVDRSLVSMSLGGSGAEETILNEVAALTDDGVVVIVAAGNSNGDACNYTPSQAPSAITVGATDVQDESAGFTNWGSCVDIFAPGVNVLSTIPGNQTDVYDGTSMACPHVSGVVARYLQMQTSPPLPSNVASWLKSVATRDAITWSRTNHDQSPNLLLFANC